MKVCLSSHFTYKRLLRFVLPTIFMMIVTSIYSIVDGFFVSNCVGKEAFTAVNLIMPVIMICGSFGFMIGSGGSALIAKTMGEGDKDRANRYFSMLIVAVSIMSVVVVILGLIFMPNLAVLLGAKGKVLEYSSLYGRLMMISIGFFMLQNCFQSFLVTAEKSKLGLAFSMISGICNIVFDYIFVYKLNLGVSGAAIATAISEIVGGVIPLIYFVRKNTSLLKLVRTKLEIKPILKACGNGSSEMLTNLSASVVSMIYNIQLLKLAGNDGVSAYGVIMYVNFMFIAFFLGYSIGCNPIVGYNFGAGNKKELKNILSKSLITTGVVAVIMTTIGITLAFGIAKIFVGYDAELCSLTTYAFRIYSISFLFSGFNIFTSAFFTGLNNGKISAIVSFSRTFLFQVAAVILLPMVFGIDSIWFAISVAEFFALIISTTLLIKNKRRYGY